VGARNRGRAALGFSVHTGWAAALALGGPAREPEVLDRRRVEMILGSDPGKPPYVYHAARALDLRGAEKLVREYTAVSRKKADAAVKEMVAALKERDMEVVAGAVLVADKGTTPSLEAILASHTLIHAAEGEMYRSVIRDAIGAAGIAARDVRAKEVKARAAAALGTTEAKLGDWLERIGRAAGKPWAKDQKDACLAALLAL
jgi:hypothetical protein